MHDIYLNSIMMPRICIHNRAELKDSLISFIYIYLKIFQQSSTS
jgi:hypothetical protein